MGSGGFVADKRPPPKGGHGQDQNDTDSCQGLDQACCGS